MNGIITHNYITKGATKKWRKNIWNQKELILENLLTLFSLGANLALPADFFLILFEKII